MTECLADGCTYPAGTRGLCRLHWKRAKRDGTLTRYPAKRVSKIDAEEILEAAQIADTDACIRWPFGLQPNGYPAGAHHRKSCEIAHGAPPDDKPHAAHSCGVRSCVNPRHLRWASAKENGGDKVIHQARSPLNSARLVSLLDENAEAIREQYASGASPASLARKYGARPEEIWRVI